MEIDDDPVMSGKKTVWWGDTLEEAERQESLKETYEWDLFAVDTEDLWYITNYIVNDPYSGVIYTHIPTYRPMIIIRAPPIPDTTEHTTYTIFSQKEGFPFRIVDEPFVSEQMPLYLKEIEDTYLELGPMERDESERARLVLMCIAGLGEVGSNEPVKPSPLVEERKIVTAKRTNHSSQAEKDEQ